MGILEDIKNDAKQTGAKLQTSEERDIEELLNNLFYLDKNIPEELKFLKSVMTRGAETTERKGLHASAVIVSDDKFCYRQQLLSLFYKQLQGEQTPIGLKRIFSEGDAIHEKWQRLFIRGGLCKPLDCDYSRFADEYDLSYTPDIICALPVDMKLSSVYDDSVPKEPYVVEIKSVNTFTFKKQKYHASGRKQCQLYMYLTGIHKGIVLCDDKNTQEFKVYKYEYNPSEIAPYIRRLEQIQEYKQRLLKKHKIVSRHTKCIGYNCKMAQSCPMREVCYKKSKERI
nr:MAG TPA: Exonuclease [Caudoviricetes sp.]